MNNVIVILDDTNAKSEVIKDVIGDRGFSNVVVKRKSLKNFFFENILKLYPQPRQKVFSSTYEREEF